MHEKIQQFLQKENYETHFHKPSYTPSPYAPKWLYQLLHHIDATVYPADFRTTYYSLKSLAEQDNLFTPHHPREEQHAWWNRGADINYLFETLDEFFLGKLHVNTTQNLMVEVQRKEFERVHEVVYDHLSNFLGCGEKTLQEQIHEFLICNNPTSYLTTDSLSKHAPNWLANLSTKIMLEQSPRSEEGRRFVFRLIREAFRVLGGGDRVVVYPHEVDVIVDWIRLDVVRAETAIRANPHAGLCEASALAMNVQADEVFRAVEGFVKGCVG